MSSSSEDNDTIRGIALQYYKALQEYDSVDAETLRRNCWVTKKQKSYLKKNFPGKRFLHFLRKFPDMFFLENGVLAPYDISLEINRRSAIMYFEEILKQYDKPIGISNLKGHIGQADVNIRNFINSFYAGPTFEYFLRSYSEAFIVYRPNRVSSTVKACVGFYRRLLNDMGEGVYYYSLLMNNDKLRPEIKTFLKSNYPGENFCDFLEEHSECFQVDENGFVYFDETECDNNKDEIVEDETEVIRPSLSFDAQGFLEYVSDEDSDGESDVEEEAAEFFEEKLKNLSYYPEVMKLRAFNSQAVKRIKDYIDENYPDEEFIYFLQSQPHHFIVYDDKRVNYSEDECLSFLKGRLETFGEGFHSSTLNIHVGEADLSVRAFLRSYCREREFQSFLENHSEYFTVDGNGFVFLSADENGSESDATSSYNIETTAAEYFEQFLFRNEASPHFMSLRGHIGQASEEVIDFINNGYPNDEFYNFLLNQPDFFLVGSDGTVQSTENVAVRYFEGILDEFGGGIFWHNLQLHLQEVAPFLQKFFLNKYPGEQFRNFFLNHGDVFTYDSDGLVDSRVVFQAQGFEEDY